MDPGKKIEKRTVRLAAKIKALRSQFSPPKELARQEDDANNNVISAQRNECSCRPSLKDLFARSSA